ncbi:6835_t:CDS:2, partial [Racocetra fulgida]
MKKQPTSHSFTQIIEENVVPHDQSEEQLNKGSQEDDKLTNYKQESTGETNHDSVQEEIVTVLGEGVVNTPPSLCVIEIDMPQNQTKMPSSISENNTIQNQVSLEQSVEPDCQSPTPELSNIPQPSLEQSLPKIGLTNQSENNNMDTDDILVSQIDQDSISKSFRAKAADLFDVPNNVATTGDTSHCEFGPSSNPNATENAPSWDNSVNNSTEYNYGKEPRRWRGRRSPSSQADNEKSDHKIPFNLPKLTDADFQALPSGSRLFLGNLSTHSTSKKELYDIFSPHGEILQISIKNSFGFVQYNNPESVKKAIEKENGLEVSHGKPWHHIPPNEDGSKPSFANRQEKHWNQRGCKEDWYQNDRDYPPGRGHQGQSYPDRRYDDYDRRNTDYKFDRRASYDSRGGYEYSDQRDYRSPQEYRGDYKDEHEYRPRDDRGYRRSSYRDEHRDERYAQRSKPYRIPSRDYMERRQSRDHPYRSQSHDEPDDEFPLPRRQGNDVPECQIIVLEEKKLQLKCTIPFLQNSNFLWQVESSFREANITVHTLHLSRKLHIQAVIRQMIVEGVHAVVFMERHNAINGRVNMQIFDQSRVRDNVKYDEYNNIKVDEAVNLLLRTRILQRQGDLRPPDNLLLSGQPNLSQSQQGQPGPAGLHPISLSNVNFAALANLLGTLQQQQPPTNPNQGIQPMPMIPLGSIQPSHPGLLNQQQPQNIDVQQLLRQLAPQNTGLPNQPPFMPVPPHMAPNLGPPPSPYNAPMVGQPPSIVPPNPITPNGLSLAQHQSQHINSNVPQFSTTISTASNVTDLMA